jgi:hypothetical protein
MKVSHCQAELNRRSVGDAGGRHGSQCQKRRWRDRAAFGWKLFILAPDLFVIVLFIYFCTLARAAHFNQQACINNSLKMASTMLQNGGSANVQVSSLGDILLY